MASISLNYNIKDLFKEDEWNEIEKDFICLICCEPIYNQKWYQCTEGHTGCHKCWVTIISEGSKKCYYCSTPTYSLTEGLSRCRFMEHNFANKQIFCPYKFKTLDNINIELEQDIENGCKDVIKVEQLEDHQKNCNSRFVKCNNIGCYAITRYQKYLEHQQQCEHTIIKCELCSTEIKKSSLSIHQISCPSKIITCNQCPAQLKKSELEEHINNECPNTIIECEFKEYGCNHEIKKSEISAHLELVNHTIYMLKLIKKQSQQLHKYNSDLQECKRKINYLKKINNKQLIESKDQYTSLLNKFNSFINLNNDISYSNIWTISNFKEKSNSNNLIFSPLINLQPYSIQLSAQLSNNHLYCYLYIKGLSEGKVKAKYSIILLDEDNNYLYGYRDGAKFELEYEFDINGSGYGDGFDISELKSNHSFDDELVKFGFSIYIEKQSLHS